MKWRLSLIWATTSTLVNPCDRRCSGGLLESDEHASKTLLYARHQILNASSPFVFVLPTNILPFFFPCSPSSLVCNTYFPPLIFFFSYYIIVDRSASLLFPLDLITNAIKNILCLTSFLINNCDHISSVLIKYDRNGHSCVEQLSGHA